VSRTRDLSPFSSEVAFEKRARLLNQNIADDRPLQAGVVDQVFEGPVLDRSVILFDHIDHPHPVGGIFGNREPHGVRRAIARKAIAAPASVTEIATLILMAFGGIGRNRVAGSAKQIA